MLLSEYVQKWSINSGKIAVRYDQGKSWTIKVPRKVKV